MSLPPKFQPLDTTNIATIRDNQDLALCVGARKERQVVLIVDDEPLIAETLGLIFNRCGLAAEVVHSTDEALAFAKLSPPDLVLCDIEMPVRDGISLMNDLGRDFPDCPILVLTGAYRSLGRIQDLAAKLHQQVSILIKPCQPDELLRIASTLIEGAR